ncbi:carbohydrate-binding family 9-like protein [bacterium]|nr:carbohydrate-binding family 9-like protein [bacterium]
MVYQVQRAEKPVEINAVWDKEPWKNVEPLTLTFHAGEKPEHFPKVQAKLVYDPENLYVIFRVEDQYVKAVGEKDQDMVCNDSCTEFFFTPDMDTGKGYFNIEMNCGGVMLFRYQIVEEDDTVTTRTPIREEFTQRIERAHTMPKQVLEEIQEPTTWVVEYRVPIEILKPYMEVQDPAPGVMWRANFYKCANKTSHPHWLTWAPIDWPTPKMHAPWFFGCLQFK